QEELAVSNLDISVNKGNLLHSRYPGYNGQGTTVSVKENRPDTTDIDLKGRWLPTPYSSPIISSHATIMATIIAGAGNSYYEGKGMATGATISSADFSNLLPEPDITYQQFDISVQNHSYGTGIENYYGADAAAYDFSTRNRASLLHVFSAGNAGTQTSATGPYAGVMGFANITGSFKMAKNILTVGHMDSLGVVLAPSSRGPAFDGRVKPELVAFGEDGSSGAAAIVSGTALTLQHAYKDLFGVLPSAALVKAILLNSADDTGPKGIDFISGYGSVNAFKAMKGLTAETFFENTISAGNVNSMPLFIPEGTDQVKITLTWTDPPAIPNAAKALINGLDLELALPATGQTWQPWVLNHFPHPDSLQQPAVRKKDSLNNVEQISITDPVPGAYLVYVNGSNISNTAAQSYAIAYQIDSVDQYGWQYPTDNDNIFNNRSNTLRWNSTFSAMPGILEYSIDNGSNWQLIDDAVNLADEYYKWSPPDTFVIAILRMRIGPKEFRSDAFTISRRLRTFVGYNCADSFLFYWEKIPGISTYQVYKLGDDYLEPLLSTNDTFAVVSRLANPTLYYTVAPVINNKIGLKAFTFNYTMQGVECYIRSFFASLNGNEALLDLLLGTVHNILSVQLEKWDGEKFVKIGEIAAPTTFNIQFTDARLQKGLNTYRVRIEVAGGQVIYSLPETVHYFAETPYIIFPNPVEQGQQVHVLAADIS
ncbi:MAG TPA: S8 family serine peptidase, partial [Chitinophagaceae bacterium]|nr:S8 family serine peptidase [Chitinophagaceae bacterium]